jgi:2'-5' RNA ligase
MTTVQPVPERSRPLIVSLEVGDEAQARFDAERAALFPAGRTVIGAHVTLFHALPGPAEAAVTDGLAAAASAWPPFEVEVAELMSLGRGMAYRLRSAALLTLHRRLQAGWWDQLGPQDRQGFRPHVTVQNKVSPETARRTLEHLRAEFVPFATTARALRLWRYDGGPWTPRGRFPLGTPLFPDAADGQAGDPSTA